jgi:hypothetical protein
MRNAIVIAASIAVLLMLGTAASAGTAARVRAYVPFDFHVGEELLAAGNYIFELRSIGLASSSSSIVAVYRPDGTMASLIPTMPTGWNNRRTSDCRLHFTRLTNSYFLATVEAPEAGADLRMSKAERELRAQNTDRQDVILLAQR